MSFHLQRVRFSVHTKKQLFAGTNSAVSLCYLIEEKHLHDKLRPGVHCAALDKPFHDDFQSGKADSYEVDFGTGHLGKAAMGHPMPAGVQFETLNDVRSMQFNLKIDGGDQWVFDRYAMGGFFVEVRALPGAVGRYEEVELGWVELARHSGDVAMSSDPAEGVEGHPIELNGSFR